MKDIIMTADDFGMCQAVDEAIIDLIEIGMLTTTNVITNMETLVNAIVLREKYPFLSVGIHWNVTAGKPVSEIGQIETLVDNQGCFFSLSEFRKRMSRNQIRKEHIETELLNQYQLFAKYCGKADYWNTHQNSVLNRKAYQVFSRTAKKLGINSTRNFQRVYLDYDLLSGKQKLREKMVQLYLSVWFGYFIKQDFAMPGGRLTPFKHSSQLEKKRLVKGLRTTSKKTIEMVLHPSLIESHPFFGSLQKARVLEYQFFMDPSTVKAFQEFNLVNFDFKRINEGKGKKPF